MRSNRSKRIRRGALAAQTALVLIIVGVGVVAGVATLGGSTKSEMNQTASEVGDPASLVNRWNKQDGDCGDDGCGEQ